MSKDILNVKNNWVIVPAPWRVNTSPSANDQKWLMTLTGIADIDFRGNSSDWCHETFRLYLDWQSPVSWAYGKKLPKYHGLVFSAEQWAPFATINSIYNVGHSLDAGYAVNSCKPILDVCYNLPETKHVDNAFKGLIVEVGIRDTDAYLYKIGFHVTLLGKIVLFPEN